jgi:hypothetical protein
MIIPLDRPRKLIRREPLKHDKSYRDLHQVGRKTVTVCVACLCTWTYGPNDIGRAALTASDREITAGDIEYEPPQFKVSFQTKRAIILIAGDYPTHTEALQQTQKTIINTSEDHPATIAEIYASSLRQVKFKHACDIYLGPLGLTSDVFLSSSGISNDIVISLANQVQSYSGQLTEAIVVAADDAATHLYLIDSDSKVTCQDDVGFVAIGIGSWHAKSLLMQAKYFNRTNFAAALSLAFSAKKRAEIAPGVGRDTDMFIVNKTGWAPVAAELQALIESSYQEYDKRHAELLSDQYTRLGEAFAEIAAKYAQQAQPGAGTVTPALSTAEDAPQESEAVDQSGDVAHAP